MKKASKKNTETTTEAAALLLKYQVTPQEIYYTRDSTNPSVVVLTIGATNTSSQDVTIDAIQVRIIVKADGVDPAKVLTDEPSTIVPVSQQNTDWSFERVDDSTYMASPLNGGIVPAKATITFQLQSIIVNESGGTTTVTVVEKNASGFPTQDFLVNKIRSALEINSFAAIPIEVPPGGTTTLSWVTTAAARVTLYPGNPPNLKTTGSYQTALTETTVYTLTAYGEGPIVSKQFTVSVPAPRIVSFTISPDIVNAGDLVTLSWVTENTNYCSINPGFPTLPSNGSVSAYPTVDTVYTLTAFSLSGKQENLSRTVTINPVSIRTFTALPDYGVGIGTPVILNWDVVSTTNVTLSPGQGSVAKAGNKTVMPGSKTTYSLVAQGKNGPASSSLTVIPMMAGWNIPNSNAPWNDNGQPVLLMKDTMLWIMAMGDSPFVFTSDDGVSWNVIGNAGYGKRSSAGGAVFKGRLWVMGGAGVNGGAVTNDVWSSADGATWSQATANAGWSARRNFGCIAYNGQLWVIGGLSSSSAPLNDVWSSADGVTWTPVTTAAPWKARSNFGLVEFNGAMYIVCGKLSSTTASNELWYSTDGKIWTPIALSDTLSRRYDPNTCMLNNNLYVAGGTDELGKALTDMTYMAPEGNWVVQPGIRSSSTPQQSGCVQYQNALWIIGGKTSDGGRNRTVLYYFPGS